MQRATLCRFYSNSLAAYIVNSDPSIKTVFNLWKKQQSQALISELEKKQNLKANSPRRHTMVTKR